MGNNGRAGRRTASRDDAASRDDEGGTGRTFFQRLRRLPNLRQLQQLRRLSWLP